MNHSERYSRRITSIPPRTSLDVLRGGVTIQIGGGSLPGGWRVSREPIAGETDWSKVVAKQVFQKPLRQEKTRPKPLYERDRKIEWETEVMGDYNNKGDLGIILQFAGIEFTGEPFSKSRHDRTDRPVFYIPVRCSRGITRLFLATREGILISQIVPAQMDVNPFFQEELRIPQLAATHNPASMTVFQNNKLVIVGYNPRNY